MRLINTMKRWLSALLLCILSLGVNAQNLPQNISMEVAEFSYKKPDVMRQALGFLTALPDKNGNSSLSVQDKSMQPQMQEAVVQAVSNLPWISISTTGDADYQLRGIFVNLEKTNGHQEAVSVQAQCEIVDMHTNKVVAHKLIKSYSVTVESSHVTTDEHRIYAASSLRKAISQFILEALPIKGTVLEKGVEQKNGKTKDNQCYVDLGDGHGLIPDMRAYVLKDGKYIGELKLKESMGDEMSAWKITDGSSNIAKALEKGEILTVTSQPKKIKDM